MSIITYLELGGTTLWLYINLLSYEAVQVQAPPVIWMVVYEPHK